MHWFFLAATVLSPGDGTAVSPGTPVVPHSLVGRVTTKSGQPVPDARVLVVELRHSVQTDPDGRYKVPNLNPGSYTVSFSQIGYAPETRRITLGDSDLTLDVSLKESLVELPPIQVTATPNATEPLTSPQPTAVVEGQDLHNAQSPSLGETLNRVAGVHSLSTGVGIGKPVIRGLTSNRVLILDDGQRLETQQWGDEHGPNLETEGAERIEVIRGPASVLYGSDALGGVVNVIQPPLPVATEGHGPVEAQLSASYGTNNRQPDGALSIAGARGGFAFRGTVSGRQSDDLQTPDYDLWNSGNEAVGGSGTVGYRGSWGSVAGTISQRNEKIELTDEDPTATPLQRIATTRGPSEPDAAGVRLTAGAGGRLRAQPPSGIRRQVHLRRGAWPAVPELHPGCPLLSRSFGFGARYPRCFGWPPRIRQVRRGDSHSEQPHQQHRGLRIRAGHPGPLGSLGRPPVRLSPPRRG